MEMFDIHQGVVLFLLLLLLHFIYTAASQPSIGVFLRTDIINMPDRYVLSRFLNATYITNLRTNFDRSYVRPLLRTGVTKVIIDSTDNLQIPFMASNKEIYVRDFATHILPNMHTLLVGNKVFEHGDQSIIDALVPAMENVQSVMDDAGLRGNVKVSTLVSLDVLTKSDIPSEAAFKPAYLRVIVPLLKFLRSTDSALHISTFPYYDYLAYPTPHTLNLCLFQPNSGRLDPGTGKNYTNMFAIKVDSMRNALDGLGFQDIEIVVAETGWPTSSNKTQFGGSLTNARLYNWNLIAYLRSMVGTPLMPNKSVETYIFSLFDLGDLDSDVSNELKSCGIVQNDFNWKYDLLCLKR